MTKRPAANTHPAQDMAEALGQPSHPMTGPLSSYTVPAMAHPRTPSRSIRPRTYTPVPATIRVTTMATV